MVRRRGQCFGIQMRQVLHGRACDGEGTAGLCRPELVRINEPRRVLEA